MPAGDQPADIAKSLVVSSCTSKPTTTTNMLVALLADPVAVNTESERRDGTDGYHESQHQLHLWNRQSGQRGRRKRPHRRSTLSVKVASCLTQTDGHFRLVRSPAVSIASKADLSGCDAPSIALSP